MLESACEKMPHTFECHNLGYWKDYINNHFPALEIRTTDHQNFFSYVTHRRFGQVDFSYIDTSAITLERTFALARRSEAGYVKILWQLRGELEIEQGNRNFILHRGDISICDTSRRYRLQASNGSRHAVLMLPHDIDRRLPAAAAQRCATSFTEESAYQAALGAILGLLNQSSDGSLRGVDSVIETINNMLVNALINHHEHNRHGSNRLEAARRYVEDHISAIELNPEKLARGLNLSRRSLYNTLAHHDTTPARIITEVRLNHARTRLEQDDAGERLIDIAHASGFKDSAHFSRAFKQYFGEPPSHWRARRS